MTKEEIIKNHKIDTWSLNPSDRDSLSECLDEYAKQQSIAFNRWLFDNKFAPNSSFLWFNYELPREDVRFFKPEELYSSFLRGQSAIK